VYRELRISFGRNDCRFYLLDLRSATLAPHPQPKDYTTMGNDPRNPDQGNPGQGNPDQGNPGQGNPGQGNPGQGNPG
jgi:hypothetical protein